MQLSDFMFEQMMKDPGFQINDNRWMGEIYPEMGEYEKGLARLQKLEK